ncbi:MAG: RNA repair transcriptional activator RtcR [Proteobacteria bacterium]|nr:RNA repair transcriptional activator RtcR [Pseudomonadota bacterium]
MRKPNIIFGYVGSTLDVGKSADRWSRWRPTVALCQQEDIVFRRFELLYDRNSKKLADLIKSDIETVSPETKVTLHQVGFRDPWDFEEVYSRLYEFFGAYKFETDDESYFANITTGTHVFQICLYLLCESRRLPAKLIQSNPKHGAKPSEPNGTYQIIDLDLSRYDKLASRFHEEKRVGTEFLKSGIQTKNLRFNAMISEIEQVASVCEDSILLTGPTGAGKSMLAKKIYELKKSKHQISGALVEVNCATLRGDNAISALFGHVRGAFTGAQNARQGLLKAAHKGLLFLDEIGEMGLDEQAMLLRAIEEKSFFPLGSDKQENSDFQLIAGTNRDLWQDVRNGTFREDLLARINLWSFDLPGLKDRIEDLAPNLDFEIHKYEQRTGQTIRFNSESKQKFLKFAESAPWPANFRDLTAAITRMATLAPSGCIDTPVVEGEIDRLNKAWKKGVQKSSNGELYGVLSQADLENIDEFDRLQLEQVIRVCFESKSLSDAGRRLFAVSRQRKKISNDADRLKKFLERFNISAKSIWS